MAKGRYMRSRRTLLAAVAVAGAMALPATVAGAASSSKLWVNSSAVPVGGTGTSCAHPGYQSVQAAINNAGNFGATVEVCTGTYVEQLTITNSVKLVSSGGAVIVKLPAAPANNATSCDVALSSPGQDEISICGAGNVSITNITVSAYWPALTCYDNMNGVFVGQGSNLTASGLTVTGAGVPIGDPDVGGQGGEGIRVGTLAPDIGITDRDTCTRHGQSAGRQVAALADEHTVHVVVAGEGRPVGRHGDVGDGHVARSADGDLVLAGRGQCHVTGGRVVRRSGGQLDDHRTAGRHQLDRVGDGQLLDIGAGADLDGRPEVAGIVDGRLDRLVPGMSTARPRPADRYRAVVHPELAG